MKRTNAFGEELKRLRLVKPRWSLRDAAERIGISNPYLSQIESGHRPPPPPPVVIKIAEAYGVNAAWLLDQAGYFGLGVGKREARLQRKFAHTMVSHPDVREGFERRVLAMARSGPTITPEIKRTLGKWVLDFAKRAASEEYRLSQMRHDSTLKIDPNLRIEEFPPEARRLVLHLYDRYLGERSRHLRARIEEVRAAKQKLREASGRASRRKRRRPSGPSRIR